jgi:hypothetical protein
MRSGGLSGLEIARLRRALGDELGLQLQSGALLAESVERLRLDPIDAVDMANGLSLGRSLAGRLAPALRKDKT